MMRIDKKKVVFVSVLICIFAFIVCYYLMMFPGKQEADNEILSDPQVPGVAEPAKTYDSRIHAVNDLEDRKPSNAPSLYEEIGMDSIDNQFEDEVITDQSTDSLNWTMQSWSFNTEQPVDSIKTVLEQTPDTIFEDGVSSANNVSSEALALFQESFFMVPNSTLNGGNADPGIRVFIDGQQVVKANSRVFMRLDTNAVIGGKWYPRLTPVYAFVRFAPNRVLLSVAHIQHQPIALKAYDIEDGSDGIFTENNFRADLSREMLDEALDEVNIPSLPQVSGLSRLFQKNNRQVKVTIPDQFRLLLKSGS